MLIEVGRGEENSSEACDIGTEQRCYDCTCQTESAADTLEPEHSLRYIEKTILE